MNLSISRSFRHGVPLVKTHPHHLHGEYVRQFCGGSLFRFTAKCLCAREEGCTPRRWWMLALANLRATVEALNIASATDAHVDTISVASAVACGPLSPTYNVEAKPVSRLPRPNILQVQHCVRGRGATDIMSQCFP